MSRVSLHPVNFVESGVGACCLDDWEILQHITWQDQSTSGVYFHWNLTRSTSYRGVVWRVEWCVDLAEKELYSCACVSLLLARSGGRQSAYGVLYVRRLSWHVGACVAACDCNTLILSSHVSGLGDGLRSSISARVGRRRVE